VRAGKRASHQRLSLKLLARSPARSRQWRCAATERLQALRLLAMATAWDEQQRHPDIQSMTFDERFALLVEAEWVARETKRVGRALKEAKLRISQACIEGVECSARRELGKAVLRQLATCRWIEEHHTVLISGATGTGKTYLAC